MSAQGVVFREPEDEQVRALRWLHRMVLRHPLAAQSAYQWLVAEGRAYAATDAGADLHERLASSRLVDRLQLVWESATLGILQEGAQEDVPDAVVEVLISLAARGDLEGFLSRWFLGTASPKDTP